MLGVPAAILQEKDQMVKINAAVANHTFTCDQVIQIAKVTQMCWCSSVVACYPKIVDPENFGVSDSSLFFLLPPGLGGSLVHAPLV